MSKETRLDAPISPDGSSRPEWHLQEGILHLQGSWTLALLALQRAGLQRDLLLAGENVSWNLEKIQRLDNFGALLLWRIWGKRFPGQVAMLPKHRQLFEQLELAPGLPEPHRENFLGPLSILGRYLTSILGDLWGLFLLLGELLLEFFRGVRQPGHFPWKEISATIVKTGPDSLPILTLIGFLIGIVITYQSAPTLESYGANLYIISIAGISILREFGPMITAIILAGRSGSAFTAQIGAMRVTQELDALRTFGISPVQRLVLPRVIGLAIAVPLLVIWSDIVGICGALIVSRASLNISPIFFLEQMPVMVPQFNLWLGIAKGVLYGILIAWVSGYHGLKIRANTESLSHETTNSVVLAITMVIVIDAILAIIFAHTGISAG